MVLKSRATKATYSFDGNTLRLSARFEKLEKLREYVDAEPINYIVSALEPVTREEPDTAEAIQRIKAVLLCLQDEDAEYEEAAIHDAYFGNFAGFFSIDNILELSKVIAHLLGQDISVKLAEIEAEIGGDSGPKAAS